MDRVAVLVDAGFAKCVFHFDVPGSVAKFTHAGLPWLRFLRQQPRAKGRPAGHEGCWAAAQRWTASLR